MDRGTTDDNYSCSSYSDGENVLDLRKKSSRSGGVLSMAKFQLKEARVLVYRDPGLSFARMQGDPLSNRQVNQVRPTKTVHRPSGSKSAHCISESNKGRKLSRQDPVLPSGAHGAQFSSFRDLVNHFEKDTVVNTMESNCRKQNSRKGKHESSKKKETATQSSSPQDASKSKSGSSSPELWEQLPNWLFTIGTRKCSRLSRNRVCNGSLQNSDEKEIANKDNTVKELGVDSNFGDINARSDDMDSDCALEEPKSAKGLEYSRGKKTKQRVLRKRGRVEYKPTNIMISTPFQGIGSRVSSGVKGDNVQVTKPVSQEPRKDNSCRMSQPTEDDASDADERINFEQNQNTQENGAGQNIAVLYFNKPSETTENLRHPQRAKEKIKVMSTECCMCSTSYKYYGSAPTDLLLRHLYTKHCVSDSKTHISKENMDRMNATKEYLRKCRPNRKPSAVWDFFLKRTDEHGAVYTDCMLCEFTSLQSVTRSTGSMLSHLYVQHKHLKLTKKFPLPVTYTRK